MGAGACAGVSAAVGQATDDELKDFVQQIPAQDQDKIKKALAGDSAAVTGSTDPGGASAEPELTEDQAKEAYLNLVPTRHRQTIVNHPDVQPWGSQTWVHRLQVAKKVMLEMEQEEAAKAAAALETASAQYFKKKDEGGFLFNEAGVDKMTEIFFERRRAFYIGPDRYGVQSEEEECGRGQYQTVYTFTKGDAVISKEEFRAEMSEKDLTGVEEKVAMILLA